MRAMLSAGLWGMEGDVDGDAPVESDRGEVLVEEGLEHNDLIALLQERDENRVLSWRLP